MQSFKLIVLFLILILTVTSVTAQEYYNKFSLGMGYNLWIPLGHFADKNINNPKSGTASVGESLFLPSNFNFKAGYYINKKTELTINAAIANYNAHHNYVRVKYNGVPENATHLNYDNDVWYLGGYPSPSWVIHHYTLGVTRYFFYSEKISFNANLDIGMCSGTFNRMDVDTGRTESGMWITTYSSKYSAKMESKTAYAPLFSAGIGVSFFINRYLSLNANTSFGLTEFNYKNVKITEKIKGEPERNFTINFKQQYSYWSFTGGLKFHFIKAKNTLVD